MHVEQQQDWGAASLLTWRYTGRYTWQYKAVLPSCLLCCTCPRRYNQLLSSTPVLGPFTLSDRVAFVAVLFCRC
jgi:hypothetical protein